MADLPWGEDGPTYTKADAITAEKLADEPRTIDAEAMSNREVAAELERIAEIFDPEHRNSAAILEAAKRLKPGRSILLEMSAASAEHDQREEQWRAFMADKAPGTTEHDFLVYVGEACGWTEE